MSRQRFNLQWVVSLLIFLALALPSAAEVSQRCYFNTPCQPDQHVRAAQCCTNCGDVPLWYYSAGYGRLYSRLVEVIIPFVYTRAGTIEPSPSYLLVLGPYSDRGPIPMTYAYAGVDGNKPKLGSLYEFQARFNDTTPTYYCAPSVDFRDSARDFNEVGFRVFSPRNYLYQGTFDPDVQKLVPGYRFHVTGSATYFYQAGPNCICNPTVGYPVARLSRCPAWQGIKPGSYNIGAVPACPTCGKKSSLGPPKLSGGPKTDTYGFQVSPSGTLELSGCVDLSKKYRSTSDAESPLGIAWSHVWDVHATETFDGAEHFVLVSGLSSRNLRFHDTGAGTNLQDPDEGQKLQRNADGHLHLLLADGSDLAFNAANDLAQIQYPGGEVLTLGYDSSGRLTSLVSSTGVSRSLSYSTENKIASVTTEAGAHWDYTYSAGAFLTGVTAPDGGATTFAHTIATRPDRITGITNRRGQPIHAIGYDMRGRVEMYTDRDLSYSLEPDSGRLVDSYGRIQINRPDEAGNIHERTDETGATWRNTYDGYNNLLQTTDPNGKITVRSYDASDHLTQVIDATGAVTRFAYDSQGHLTVTTDPLGRTTRRDYDSQGRLLRTTDAAGQTRLFTYGTSGLLATESDPAGRITSYAHDGGGRVVRVTRWVGGQPVVTESAYDGAGRLLSSSDARGNVTNFEYDLMDRLVAMVGPSVSSGPGGSTTRPTTHFAYDADGNRIAQVGPRGATRRSTYDPWNRKLTETDELGTTTTFEYSAGRLALVRDPLGRETHFEYDAAGRQTARIDPLGGATRQTYDALGNPVTATDPLGHVTTRNFDAVSRITAVIAPDSSSTHMAYDAVGNLVVTTDALSHVTASTYDVLDRRTQVVGPDGAVTRSEYDAVGNRTAVVRAAGTGLQVRDEYTYDELGRLVAVTRAKGTADETTVTYTMDPVGNVTAIANGRGKVWHFEYDALNRLTQETDPLGRSKQYFYDPAGELVERRDAKGQKIQYDYSLAGKVTEARYVRADGSLENVARMQYDSVGSMTRVTDGNVDIEQSFDALNRITAINHHHLNKVQRQGWDAAGNRTWMSVEGIPNSTATYEWDSLNRLAAIHHATFGDVTYSYNAAGQKTGMTYPNGIVASYSYDTAGRIANLDYRHTGNTPFFTETLAYDTRGNVTQRVDDEGTHSYQYNWLDQLTRADYPNGSFEAFAYDKSANRSSLTTAGGTASYTVDDADQLLSVSGPGQSEITTFGWTSNGEMASKLASGQTTPTSYTWNTRSMMTRASLSAGAAVTHSYLPESWLGWRFSASNLTTGPTAMLWDSESKNVIADLDSSQSVLAVYAEGTAMDAHLMRQHTASGARHAYLADHLGSAMRLASFGSGSDASYRYTAYGAMRVREDSSGTENRFTYAGREWDAQGAVYYSRARSYDPMLGRFSTGDPASTDAVSSWSAGSRLLQQATLRSSGFNEADFKELAEFLGQNRGDPPLPALSIGGTRYSYASNAPTQFVDPTGKIPLPAVFIVTACGAIVAYVEWRVLIAKYAPVCAKLQKGYMMWVYPWGRDKNGCGWRLTIKREDDCENCCEYSLSFDCSPPG